MIVEKTDVFEKWFKDLKDRIVVRIRRIENDDFFGDCEPVGNKIFELRIHYGPGYRVYLYKDGEKVVILLCGGDKSTQKKDIEKAKSMI